MEKNNFCKSGDSNGNKPAKKFERPRPCLLKWVNAQRENTFFCDIPSLSVNAVIWQLCFINILENIACVSLKSVMEAQLQIPSCYFCTSAADLEVE